MKNEKYECCIKCGEPVKDRGQTVIGDGISGDGYIVGACDNPECIRYGLLTTVTK